MTWSSYQILLFLLFSSRPNQAFFLSKLEERVIHIGKNEGLSLLKASLISSATLTTGLSPFLQFIKEEKFPN
ncbi:hypothetical protein VNO77_20493 [Canavalia gladiata]|uniref:Uncharacterized protein n=1 Tax=Canavalia gladiata TaxID=3824 RepID=A0AAN9LT98_CANGL